MEETGFFREDIVRIVESGERTSALGGVLEQAAALYSMQAGWRRKIRSALTYPLAMAAVGTAVIVFLLTYVVPRLADLFADMGHSLPLPTKILLGAAAFLRSWWPALLLGAAAFGLWVKRRKSLPVLPFSGASGKYRPCAGYVALNPAVGGNSPGAGPRHGVIHGRRPGRCRRPQSAGEEGFRFDPGPLRGRRLSRGGGV